MTIAVVGSQTVRLHGRGRERLLLARYALPLMITNSAYSIYAQMDSLIIAGFLGVTAVGLFSAPTRLLHRSRLLLVSRFGQRRSVKPGPTDPDVDTLDRAALAASFSRCWSRP